MMLSATVSKRLEALPECQTREEDQRPFRLLESQELWQEAYAKIHTYKGAITHVFVDDYTGRHSTARSLRSSVTSCASG